MIYKFKSQATGDLIMFGASGDEVLRILGRDPAPTGILAVADLPAAVAAIEAAVAQRELACQQAAAETGAECEQPPSRNAVSLRQRTWPLLEMMKRAHAAGADIVWGV